MVETRTVTDRRALAFSSMADIMADVDYLDSGDPPRTSGNWTAAQIVQHVAMLIEGSIEGFTVKAPLWLRLAGRLGRGRALAKPWRPGLKLPGALRGFEPDAGIAWEDAVEYLRARMRKLETRRMTQPSPVLGRLSHEEWAMLHCRHAELHFSFMHPA